MSSNYQTGYRAEIKARNILQSWGFTVIRSAKSGGPFDLIGFNETKIILLQIKSCPFGKIPMYKNTKKKLAKIPAPANAKMELWVWERRSGFHHFPI